ncbi:MAG: bifunctional GNAT family N-acetyltransferase/carbon-nitrogen hydrolase family protein [SAR324 cluster bacterium]|nr:bifunctional GNAT family N-acetyltransferase/carbon-nitrogen hydrolase family protein [SAR324 cluster bacterium]
MKKSANKKISSKKEQVPGHKSHKHQTRHKLLLRNIQHGDYNDLREIMERVYSHITTPWEKEQYEAQLAKFPEGQICIEDNGKVVAAALSLIVDYEQFGDKHTYVQITGNGYLTTHNPKGDTLYGMDIMVHPGYQGLRLGRRLYDARKELCEKLNLRRIIAGGRIPGYKRHAEEMSPQTYIRQVKNKEIYDPVLSFQLSNEFHVRKLMQNYWFEDTDSHTYATLLEWINIYYESTAPLFGGQKTVVRVGIVQWQMRTVNSVEELVKQIEFFVDTLSDYQCDFILFPEYISAPLMSQFESTSASDALRALSQFTDRMKLVFSEFAVSYNVNIIAGSMPEYDQQKLRNVAFLFKRDGSSGFQHKIHVTPDEAMDLGMRGGDALHIFDTDVGKIGILVCYDVEFPELSRFLAEQGMNILFVPTWTDTKNAYLRVRRCAQARAIENECYVALAGSVGNLPNLANMDIQYSQSAVFCPSDFAFPHDAIVAEATPNTEMTLIADLDLELLKELRLKGSVQNFKDRRLDLYRLQWIKAQE